MRVIILEDKISCVWDDEIILEELGIQVVGVYKSWKLALPKIKNELPDFLIVDLFLDNNEKGLDFIREMNKYHIPSIICTGYPEKEYLEEALEAGVKAFLPKPIDKAAFTFQVRKLVNELNSGNQKYLVVRDNRILVKVPFNEIFKIVVDLNYTSIYLKSSKRYMVKISLKKLLSQLDPNKFVRCHRSTVINIMFLESIDPINNVAKMSNNEELPIGKKFKSALKKAFSKYGS